MVRPGETELELVQRQVREAEEQIVRQREVVNRLAPSGEIAGIARGLLTNLEESLASHRARLARLLRWPSF